MRISTLGISILGNGDLRGILCKQVRITEDFFIQMRYVSQLVEVFQGCFHVRLDKSAGKWTRGPRRGGVDAGAMPKQLSSLYIYDNYWEF